MLREYAIWMIRSPWAWCNAGTIAAWILGVLIAGKLKVLVAGIRNISARDLKSHKAFMYGAVYFFLSLASANAACYAAVHIGKDFGGHALDSLFILLPLSGVIFLLEFQTCQAEENGRHYFFGAKDYFDYLRRRLPDDKKMLIPQEENEGSRFDGHSKRYGDLAKLLITLSVGIIAFFVNTGYLKASSEIDTVEHIRRVTPILVGYFGFAVATLIAFMVLQATWYEQYCNDFTRSSYKAWKYATCVSLGVTGLVSFTVGILWIALGIF